jgi:GT2 family glycosyltransferase
MPDTDVRVGVVVCAFTLARRLEVLACVRSVLEQKPAPGEIIVVVDHNEDLRQWLLGELPRGVLVVSNVGPPGLSGSRNTGVGAISRPIVAFIDDDAVAEPGWLAGLCGVVSDDAVIGAGGQVLPIWTGERPAWFPEEFLWVVGCSYRGMVRNGPVRNMLGCNMAFRASVFAMVGGFDPSVGRIGSHPLGCEETELCIRARRARPDADVVAVEGAVVRHNVTLERQRFAYFVTRCFHEGLSKALIRRLSDGDALSVERLYATTTLPVGIAREVLDGIRRGRPGTGLARAGAIMTGLLAATVGFGLGCAALRHGRAGGGGARHVPHPKSPAVGAPSASTDSTHDPATAEGGVTVVICAFSGARRLELLACVGSVSEQVPAPREIVVVVDHNDELRRWLTHQLPTDVHVVANAGPYGLSGARNTGIAMASQPIVAFIDDDAVAEPGWLSGLSAAVSRDGVIGAGGHVMPVWAGERPAWLLDEFLWVVGCSYRGMVRSGPVRNVLGGNMALRAEVFDRVGGFDPSLGRLGSRPLGCEETELCIRARRGWPGGRVVAVEGAVLRHHVTPERQRFAYLLRRCFHEGSSKALIWRLTDGEALSAERSYAVKTVPAAVAREIAHGFTSGRPVRGMARATTAVTGLLAAVAGFGVGLTASRARRPGARVGAIKFEPSETSPF